MFSSLGDGQVSRRIQSLLEKLVLQLLQHSLRASLPEPEASFQVRRQEASEVHDPRQAVPAVVWKPLGALCGGQQLNCDIRRK